LKGYRAEIDARRQSLLREQAEGQQQLDVVGIAVRHAEALTEYCARVQQQLQAFDHAEKRMTLQALNIRVSWTPGHPLAIQGSIPIEAIVACFSSSCMPTTPRLLTPGPTGRLYD
jgi:hypothetical protein